MKLKIMEMRQEHIAQIAQLEQNCFSDPWSENSIRSELENPLSLWLVAVDGEQVIGYIGSQTAAGESDVMNLAVAPAFRCCGIGQRLVEELVCALRRNGVAALTLEVRDSNAAAIGLYEKLGFTCIGVRPNYYFHPREDARIMRKELI